MKGATNPSSGMRYLLKVRFVNDPCKYNSRVPDISQPFKALTEARSFKSIVDQTVQEAHVIDQVTGKIVESWAGIEK